MAGYEKRINFLEAYIKLCKKHGYYIDSARSERDLRVFRYNPKIGMDQDNFSSAIQVLVDDVGGIGG
jgi:hypothetical protein